MVIHLRDYARRNLSGAGQVPLHVASEHIVLVEAGLGQVEGPRSAGAVLRVIEGDGRVFDGVVGVQSELVDSVRNSGLVVGRLASA